MYTLYLKTFNVCKKKVTQKSKPNINFTTYNYRYSNNF